MMATRVAALAMMTMKRRISRCSVVICVGEADDILAICPLLKHMSNCTRRSSNSN